MKIFETITHSNFELYAAQHYNNPECTSVDEFKEDLSRFKYLKRLLKRYEQAGDLQERLILNHLIVLYNVFGIEAADRMLWYKVDENHWPIIKTFLVFLHYLEESHKVEIPLDNNVIQRLREL